MFRMALAVAVLLGLVVTPQASAASLVEVTNFGPNPGNLRLHVYKPDRVAARPGILLAVHYCTGSGPDFHNGAEFGRLADQYGFVIVYPSVTRADKCFDVSSPQALRRDGGSDPVGLMSMVRWALRQYGGDPGRVFVTGVSSGAMMTNVMVADYPDVFQAGAAFAGVPDGCFATNNGSTWNSECANVHRLSTTPTSTDHPQANWTRRKYSDKVESISLQNVGHNLMAAGMALRAIQFFGLDRR